jgi:UPF0176 protein
MIEIAAFYQFADLPDYAALRERVKAACVSAGARGSVLLASEGVNATIAAPQGHMTPLLEQLRQITGLTLEDVKFSEAKTLPFQRMKVRLKKEIVTLGVAVDPLEQVGTYVAPEHWNALIRNPDVITIDTRNDFEVEFGRFSGAINPKTKSFGEFVEFAKSLTPHKDKTLALYCTGGIRCEKATSLLKHMGFENVCHLKGGILKYLEEIKPQESLWQGGCFVFDERVALTHGLTPLAAAP